MPENQEKQNFKKISHKKQQEVYDIARKFGGETTVSDIYANSSLTIDDIEDVLAELNAKDYIKTKINEQTSIIKYIFPEIKRDYFNKKRNLAEKIGLDKLVLRLKYGDLNQKPVSDLERAVLQTAQEFSGILAMAQIVEYTGLSVDEAESVLSGLSAKGICRKQLKEDLNNLEYSFPEIIETAEKRKESEEENKNLLNIPQNFSKQLLKNFKRGTDKYLIKSKVRRYRRRSRQNMFFDTITPGIGHLLDKRWSLGEYFLFILIPMILTAGLSFIPSMGVMRYQTLKYYSISEKDLNKNLRRLNKNSLISGIFLFLLYMGTVGIDGFIQYYSYLLKMIGL